MKTVRDFIFLGSKTTKDGDCSHEIKRCLLLGRKGMTNPDSILKSRDITLLTKACGFPLVRYGCESWTIKKAECWRIDAFGFWCWRRLLRVTWTARWSTQSILKEISSEYSLERLMLKLKLQFFGHLMHWKRPWCWERFKIGGEGTKENEMVGWHHGTHWIWIGTSSRSWWWPGKPGVLQPMGSQRDWTELLLSKFRQFLAIYRIFQLFHIKVWGKGKETCWEMPGCTQSMTSSWNERGTCKAVLPLGVVLGVWYVPFLFLSYCCWVFC